MATTPAMSSPPASTWREEPSYSGWILFAGIILLTVGFLDVMYGLAAIINDKVIHVGGTGGVVIADFTTWGWVTLSIGALMALTGCGLLTGWGWARWSGIFFAGINWKGNAPGDGANVPLEEVLPRFFDVHDLRHAHATRLLMDG